MVNRGDSPLLIIKKSGLLLQTEGWYGIKYRLGLVTGNEYSKWINRYDNFDTQTRSLLEEQLQSLKSLPKISIVMPVYNPKETWLSQAIESVLAQVYPYWELCIADDASSNPAIKTILNNFAQQDSRIKVVFREHNGHICAASNTAFTMATGEWMALLDHDDLLPEHALFWVARSINDHPDAMLIYSDEDKIDKKGSRVSPYFKPEWNPDLFYSHNMISHLGVYRTELVKKVGGFREGLEGSQDYDLALRCIALIAPCQIVHIPRVLYHWRIHEQSTAHSKGAKDYALYAGQRALNDHFQTQGIKAEAELLSFGMYRVRYAWPSVLPLVSLIIPTRNGLELLRQCLESVFNRTTYPNYEILVVDNGSDDPQTLAYLAELEAAEKITVIRDSRPFNFSALNNLAVRQAAGAVVALLNNDIEIISPDWLSEMVSHACRDGIGAVGAKLWYPNDKLQHGGVILGLRGVAEHAHKFLPKGNHGYFGRADVLQNYSAITAACLVIRKAIYEEVGGLDEINLPISFNDVDFCLRVKAAGYRNIWTPYAEMYHHESATRGQEDTPEKKQRFANEVDYMNTTWGELLLNDPAYNPNLSLMYGDFSLAWPPRTERL